MIGVRMLQLFLARHTPLSKGLSLPPLSLSLGFFTVKNMSQDFKVGSVLVSPHPCHLLSAGSSLRACPHSRPMRMRINSRHPLVSVEAYATVNVHLQSMRMHARQTLMRARSACKRMRVSVCTCLLCNSVANWGSCRRFCRQVTDKRATRSSQPGLAR
jgi:hypothetical protein